MPIYTDLSYSAKRMSVVTFCIEAILTKIVVFAVPTFIPRTSNGVGTTAITIDAVVSARH